MLFFFYIYIYIFLEHLFFKLYYDVSKYCITFLYSEFEKKIEKETDAVENKKPDTNIFQDLKETANGLSMLFGSLFGDLSESILLII